MASVLYVEDDAEIAGLVVEVLRDVYEVEWAPDGESGLRAALRGRFDVMVVDRRLPGLDGVELVTAVRRARITTPILMLTALDSVADRVEGLDAGANDYLAKPFEVEELLARLRALVRGFRAEGRRREVGQWLFVPESAALYSPTGLRVSLTAAEAALLELLSSSPEHIFGREEIMRAAFPGADEPNTVDTYVHYLRRKTEPGIVETVRGRGYRLGQP